MKIKSFGCSFIYGSELAWTEQEQDLSASFAPTRPTWPALIAKHYDLPYENHAWPGIGNLRIMECVLSQAKLRDPSIFVINWSWTDRFDFVDPGIEKWQTLLPAGQDHNHKVYYRNFYSQYYSVLTSLSYIMATIALLQSKNIPFYMTVIDSVLFEPINPDWQDSLAVSLLQQQVKPNINWFDGLDFLSWSRHNHYDISESWHPLEDAHRAAADYIIKVFDTQKTIDQARQVRV